jgi:hypothetical protein
LGDFFSQKYKSIRATLRELLNRFVKPNIAILSKNTSNRYCIWIYKIPGYPFRCSRWLNKASGRRWLSRSPLPITARGPALLLRDLSCGLHLLWLRKQQPMMLLSEHARFLGMVGEMLKPEAHLQGQPHQEEHIHIQCSAICTSNKIIIFCF